MTKVYYLYNLYRILQSLQRRPTLIINRKKAAERYDVSVVTIDNWEKKGMKVIRKGRIKKPMYDTYDCDKWVYGEEKAEEILKEENGEL